MSGGKPACAPAAAIDLSGHGHCRQARYDRTSTRIPELHLFRSARSHKTFSFARGFDAPALWNAALTYPAAQPPTGLTRGYAAGDIVNHPRGLIRRLIGRTAPGGASLRFLENS